MSRQLSRSDRMAQMSKQEELIAKKKLEILEKQRTAELAKVIAANMSKATTSGSDTETQKYIFNIKCSCKILFNIFFIQFRPTPIVTLPSQEAPKFANTFNNDGSFLENFKKVTEAAKIKDEEEEVVEQNDGDELIVNDNNTTPILNPSIPEIEYPIYAIPPPTQIVENLFVSDLQSIPPPKIYVLNEIPDPRDLDLNAIPKPELNLDAIKVPDVSDAVEGDDINIEESNKG